MKHVAMIETNMSGTGFQAFSIARELGIELIFVTRDLGLYESIPGIADLFRRYISVVRASVTFPSRPVSKYSCFACR